MCRLILLFSLLSLTACGPYEKHDQGPVKYEDGNAGVDVAGVEAGLSEDRRVEAASHVKVEGLGFPKGVTISPKAPTVEDSLEAIARSPRAATHFLTSRSTGTSTGRRSPG